MPEKYRSDEDHEMAELLKNWQFEDQEIYVPEKRPGYAAWVVIWPVPGQKKEYLLSFIEKRRGVNKTYRPVPYDFWEAMGLPIKYQTSFCNGSPDVVTEAVFLKTTDNGSSWREVGRSQTDCINLFAYISLLDGNLIRAVSNDYLCFYENEIPRLTLQISADNGTTWTDQTVLMENRSTYPYRLKRLRDNTLVLLTTHWDSFGPGKTRIGRHVHAPDIRIPGTTELFFSRDEGRTWDGPLPVLQGYEAPEPDLIELETGDLLLIKSNIQGEPPVRQYVCRNSGRFVPGPVRSILSGPVPEAVSLTADGFLIGAGRCRVYSCSADDGKTWHALPELPASQYQPMMVTLDDGSCLCVWHHGKDSIFGEVDEYIGSHRFKPQIKIPQETRIDLTRDLDETQTQYVNAFTARLTCHGQPLSGKKIRFSYALRYTDGYEKHLDPRIAGESAEQQTDEAGLAHIHLDQMDRQRNIHLAYRITAWYAPADDENRYSPCQSDIYHAYGLTSRKYASNAYQAYVAGGKLFLQKSVLERFPLLGCLIENTKDAVGFTEESAVEAIGGHRETARLFTPGANCAQTGRSSRMDLASAARLGFYHSG